MISNLLMPSYSRTSKFAMRLLLRKYTPRHSTLKIRLGDEPDTDMNMPPLFPDRSVLRSSQCASIAAPILAFGRHVLAMVVAAELPNCRFPLVSALTAVYDCPYSVYANGRLILTMQSSHCDPRTR